MPENIPPFDQVTKFLKDNLRMLGVAGASLGAILVIYYCASISFYPSGLSIADSMFFLWVVVVFGIYYSIISYAFFLATQLWLQLLSIPINGIIHVVNRESSIRIRTPEDDRLLIIGASIIGNLLVCLVAFHYQLSPLKVLACMTLIGFAYVLLNHASRTLPSNNEFLGADGKRLFSPEFSKTSLMAVFYVLIYLSPLLIAHVGDGVTRTSFETMGVRQLGRHVVLEKNAYQAVVEEFEGKGYLTGAVCKESCVLPNIDLLFTGIGSSTKMRGRGVHGAVDFVVPTESIKMVAKATPVKPE